MKQGHKTDKIEEILWRNDEGFSDINSTSRHIVFNWHNYVCNTF